MIFITSYNRPDMLLSLLKELEGERITVIDDGSEYDPKQYAEYCNYIRTTHQGKQGFWKKWRAIFDIAKHGDYEELIFIQDDLHGIDLDRLRNDFGGNSCLNVLSVGGHVKWSENGYVDCNFITSRKCIDKIGWWIEPIPMQRFFIPGISSGVGEQLSRRFGNKGIKMITPYRPYAHHGAHESKMHPIERKRNPLIC